MLQKDTLHKWKLFFGETNRRDITEKQISQWIGMAFKVFLRPDGDYRCDAEFKSELADKFIDMGKIDLISMIDRKLSTCGEIKVLL